MPAAPPQNWSPGGTFWWQQAKNDPDFARLSPSTRMALEQFFSSIKPGDPNNSQLFQQQLASNPQFNSAIEEAKSAGAFDHPRSMLRNIFETAVGVAAAGVLLPAILPAAAAPSAGGAPGPLAAGYGSATTSAAVPASLAAPTKFGVGSILSGIGKVAPILGNMANASAQNQAINDNTRAQTLLTQIRAPRERLTNSVQGSIAANAQPVKAEWGGPGSGLRGDILHFNGSPNPGMLSPETRELGNFIAKDSLDAVTSGRDTLPDPGRSSTGNRILGGGATFASILAAFRGGR